MVDLDVDADLVGEAMEFTFPQTHARAVATTAIRRDHEALGVRIADTPDLIPPAADRLHGELSRVVVHSDTDPTGIGGQVVDAIRHRPAQFLDEKVMYPNLFWRPLRPPCPAGILEACPRA